MFCVLLQKNETFWCSFPLFAKELCILCVLLCPLLKNVAFFPFFYVLCKRMLRSSPFFAKELCVLCVRNVLLGLISL